MTFPDPRCNTFCFNNRHTLIHVSTFIRYVHTSDVHACISTCIPTLYPLLFAAPEGLVSDSWNVPNLSDQSERPTHTEELLRECVIHSD